MTSVLPPVVPSSSRAALRPSRTALANGVVVIAKETRKTPAVSMNLAVQAGSRYDPTDAAGAAWLLARVIDRGTTTRSAEEIAEILESRGISLSVRVDRHQLSLVCTCLSADFEPVFDLLGEVLMSPALPDAEIATRKGEVVTAIRQDEDNPAVRSVEALMSLLYGADHPFGRRVKGTVESVEAMGRSTLAAFHAARFAPSGLTVVVVGDVSEARVAEVVNRALGRWQAVAAPLAPLESRRPDLQVGRLEPVRRPDLEVGRQAPGRRRVVIPMLSKAQVDIAYGFTTIRRADPAYYAYSLLNHALGQYALGGRLGASIRERQGLAYSVGSILDATMIEGPLIVRAGVATANVDRAIASIDEELTALREQGLTLRELNESRQYLVGSMPRALETNAGIAQFLQAAEFLGLGLEHDVRLPALLEAVTLDDVQAAARRSLDPAQATVVIAGPYGEA